jgi:hypothetical protein
MNPIMDKKLLQSHSIFPTMDIVQTAAYYSQYLGFRALPYLNTQEPHICLYRDDTEIILTQSQGQKVIPNRELYGYGYDAYFITKQQEQLEKEFEAAGVNIVRAFVIEDIDGRWIAFGIKEYKS